MFVNFSNLRTNKQLATCVGLFGSIILREILSIFRYNKYVYAVYLPKKAKFFSLVRSID